MKTYFFILLFLISSLGFTQNNHIVKTEDGRRVLLKADFTWEYIDLKTTPETKSIEKEVSKVSKENSCKIASDFEEPKLDKKIQNQLKKGRATISHIKKKVAKDYDCTVEDITLLSASEKKSSGIYKFCANGKRVTYKRVGNSIIENGKFF